MRLVVVTGAPACGKLTVAQALAEALGYGVLHNHLTYDLAAAVLDPDDPGFPDLVWDLRLRILDHAVARRPGLVLTWAFSEAAHGLYRDRLEAFARARGCDLLALHLTCGRDERLRRVMAPERRGTGKIQTAEQLLVMDARRTYGPLSVERGVCLDTTHVPARASAQAALQRLRLAPTLRDTELAP